MAKLGIALQLSRLRSTRRAVVLAFGGLAGLMLVAGLSAFYLLTREPITALPGVNQAALPVPPRRLFSFTGVASPVGISVSSDGQRIFVAEGGGEHVIRVFDREGRPVAQLAPKNTEPGNRGPGGISVDRQGQLYVADRVRGTVDIYAASLEWKAEFRPPIVAGLHGWLPSGVSVGPDGRLYVAEIGQPEQSILILTPDGMLAARLSKSSGVPGGLTYPVQAVTDDDGRVYVSDGNAARVLAISPRGTEIIGTQGPESLALPRGMAVAGGKLFVADSRANRIAVFAVGDRPQYLYGFGASGDAEGLAYPNAVAVDRSERIYVADRANNRVQVWTY